MDSDGTVFWEANLSIEGNYPGSAYHILDMKATPDGGWLVSGGMFDCDYYASGFAVKFNAAFEEEWILDSYEDLPDDYIGLFNRIQIQDDKIHLYAYNDIVSIDYSGNVLNSIGLNSYLSFAVINDTQIYAFSNEWHVLSYPEAVLTNEDLPFPNNFSTIEVLNEEENILAISGYEEGAKMFQDLTEIWDVPYDSNLQRIEFFNNNNSDFGLARLYADNAILFLYNGDDASVITYGQFNFPTDVEIVAFTASGNQVVAAGKERYVPISYSEKKNVAVAFSQIVAVDTDIPQPTLDLAITNLSITNPVATTIFDTFQGSQGQQYDFMDIEVTITNNSTEQVNSFAINTSFETPINTFFCNPNLSYTQQFENASLAPGESQTIYIDTLTTYAINDTAGYQICFWVTHPDNEPDLVGENDIFCADFLRDLMTPTENVLAQSVLTVYPNPVSSYLYFENVTRFEKYDILTLEGKRIETGSLNEEQKIDVRKLAKGIYFLHVSSDKERSNFKFVKQ